MSIAHRFWTGSAEHPEDPAPVSVWQAYRDRIQAWVGAPFGLPSITISQATVCPSCNGMGNWSRNETEACPTCGGDGKKEH